MGITKGTKLTNTPKANRIAFRFDDETAKSWNIWQKSRTVQRLK